MSTTQQPEALRLADALERPGYGWHSTPAQCAAELRRLHAENTMLQGGYDAARLEIESLRARSAEPAGARTHKDYAIEHAEYMAKDAEHQPPGNHGEKPLPLLARDIAADFGVTPVQVCLALVELGFGHLSVNMAITPEIAEKLREYFAHAAQQAPAQAAPAAVVGPVAPFHGMNTPWPKGEKDRLSNVCAEIFGWPAAAPTAQPSPKQKATDAIARAEYYIDNPSAWSSFDQRISDDISAVTEALRAALAAPKPQQEAQQRDEFLRLADAIDPFTRKGAPDHLTMTVAAQALRTAAHQQEAQEPVWDGKLSDATRKVLNDLYLQCGHETAGAVSFQVRKECEALYTSLLTVKRMYHAAQQKLEALEAAPQPSPASQGDALDAARYRWLREQPFDTWKRIAWNTWDNDPVVWPDRDAAIDAARAAQDGK